MGAICYDLAISLRAHLQDKMIDNVPPEYAELLTFTDYEGEDRVMHPSLVKVGRLQDDPLGLVTDSCDPSIYVGIHYNDPSDLGDGWKHTVASSVDESSSNLGVHIRNPYQVGGGTMWWRRFWIEFSAFYVDANLDQDTASRLTAALLATLEQYCDGVSRTSPHGWNCVLGDTLGERAVRSFLAKSHGWEGGGPEDDYIWRGGIWIQVLTSRE